MDTEDKAFTQGIEDGGLRDSNEVKILICYLLSKTNTQISRIHMNEAFSSYGLVNYFEFAKALSELELVGRILKTESRDGDDYYVITKTGRHIVDTLENSLPLSVREKALSAAEEILNRLKYEAETKVDIKKTDDGYIVKCTIPDYGSDLMSVEIFVADIESATKVQENFLKGPEKLYNSVVEVLLKKNEDL